MSATEQLLEEAGELGLDADDLLRVIRGVASAAPPPPLTNPERRALLELGVDPASRSRAPLVAAHLRREELERRSWTTETAAHHLGRDPSRIRQRLVDGTLLGFRRRAGRREWLLPSFQFELGLHEEDDWATLVRALPVPTRLSPVALVAWLTAAEGGRPSRVERLLAGDLVALLDEVASLDVVA